MNEIPTNALQHNTTGDGWAFYGSSEFDLGEDNFTSSAWDVRKRSTARVCLSCIEGSPSAFTVTVEFSTNGNAWFTLGSIAFGDLSGGQAITAALDVETAAFVRARVTTPESSKLFCVVDCYATSVKAIS